VPLFFSVAGGLILLYGFIRKQENVKFLSLYFMIIAALFTVPVYLTGEGTEEAVEELPGVSKGLIENHEEMAKIGLIIIIITGITALIALILKKKPSLLKPSLILCAFLTFISFGVMAQTAHLGGRIRHTEIRNGAVVSSESNTGENDYNEKNKSENKDDD
jgi:hypothetical protein